VARIPDAEFASCSEITPMRARSPQKQERSPRVRRARSVDDVVRFRAQITKQFGIDVYRPY